MALGRRIQKVPTPCRLALWPGAGVWVGSAGGGLHWTARWELAQLVACGPSSSRPLWKSARAASGGLCSCVGLTLSLQSEALFSPLSCQILTPTQEKGSTFCQMLWPLPLQKAPANLSLCRMTGPAAVPDCLCTRPLAAAWVLFLAWPWPGAGPSAASLAQGGLSLAQIRTPELNLAVVPPSLLGPSGVPPSSPPTLCSLPHVPQSVGLSFPLYSSVKECDDWRADGGLPSIVHPQPAGEAHQDGLAEEAEVHREELAAEVLCAEGTAALLLQGWRGHEAPGTSQAVCPVHKAQRRRAWSPLGLHLNSQGPS